MAQGSAYTGGALSGLFTVVKRPRSSDDVVAQVKDAIIARRLKDGDRLPSERELCQAFGVSRATVREGLRTLEALGVIEIRPGSKGGIFAAEPDGDHVASALEALLRFRHVTAQELGEFRVSFETETAHWAAVRADDEDVAHLREIAEQFVECAAQDDTPWRVLVEVDIAFHEAIAYASKNQVRVAIMLAINRALHQASSSIEELASPPVRREIGQELREIAEAIAAHDEATAAELLRRHVKKFSELERDIQGRNG